MALIKKKKKKSGLIVGIIIGVLVIGFIASQILLPKPSIYDEATVTKSNIETYYTFSGSVESKNSQNVMASSIIQISDIKVAEGDYVEKDDVLFKTSQGAEIKAQISGTVSKIYVKEDQQVMSGSPLCDIYDFDNLQISVKVDEYDLSSISEGKEVSITIGALDKTIIGTVSSISDTATSQQGVAYFSAVIDLPKDETIKVGMTAEAKILNKQALDVLTIPVAALQFDDKDNAYVLVQDENKATVKQSVTLGINDGITAEITGGLTEGQVVYYVKTDSSSTKNSMMPSRTTTNQEG